MAKSTKDVAPAHEARPALQSFRLACLDLTRVTEQMAIMASFAAGIGRADKRAIKTIQHPLATRFYNSLRPVASGNFRLGCVDPLWVGFERNEDTLVLSRTSETYFEKNFRPAIAAPLFGGLPAEICAKYPDEFPIIDLIVNPINGLSDLFFGRFGVAAELAGIVQHRSVENVEPAGSDGALFKSTTPFAQPILTPYPNAPQGYPPGALKLPKDDFLADQFLVICTGRKSIADLITTEIDRNSAPADPVAYSKVATKWRSTVEDVLDVDRSMLAPLVAKQGGVTSTKGECSPVSRFFRKIACTFVVTLDDENVGPRYLISGKPLRCLSGSVCSAAIAAMIPHEFTFDVFAAIVPSATAHMIAVAARCMGGTFRAIPVFPRLLEHKSEKKDVPANFPKKIWYCGSNEAFIALKAEDMIRSRDCFYIATGVTPHLLLRGVRIKRDDDGWADLFSDNITPEQELNELVRRRAIGRAKVQSIVLNGSARTRRLMDHTRWLQDDTFYWQSVKELPTLENNWKFNLDSRMIHPASDSISDFVNEIYRMQ